MFPSSVKIEFYNDTQYYKLNTYSNHDCLRDLRLKRHHIRLITSLCDFAGVTSRNEYYCNTTTATCTILQRLVTTTRGKAYDFKFGLFATQMSEIFRDCMQGFIEHNGRLLTLRGSVLRSRAHLYADCITVTTAPLRRCVGTIDCTKIRICRPGWHGSLQPAVTLVTKSTTIFLNKP